MLALALLIGQTFTAHNSYSVERPDSIVPLLVERAHTCELLERIPRERMNIDFALRVGMEWLTASNHGMVYAETLEPIRMFDDGLTIQRVYYQADLTVRPRRVDISSRIEATVQFDCRVLSWALCRRAMGRKWTPVANIVVREVLAPMNRTLDRNESFVKGK